MGSMPLREAAATAATGDVWLFRGKSTADTAIRLVTNSPVNHVSMAMAIDDLPPLLWHAELGRSLTDQWTATRHRGAQLHRLEHAVSVWVHKYGQRPWLRRLEPAATRAMEDAALQTVHDFDARAFPRTGALARRWLLGRVRRSVPLEDLYCAELVATTYEHMGLLGTDRPANWYDPGKFWSGDHLELQGASLGPEIEITDVPEPPPDEER
ncbi:MAG: hypothetical protein AAGF91_07995 [Actinomycetota bacterium]